MEVLRIGRGETMADLKVLTWHVSGDSEEKQCKAVAVNLAKLRL